MALAMSVHKSMRLRRKDRWIVGAPGGTGQTKHHLLLISDNAGWKWIGATPLKQIQSWQP